MNLFVLLFLIITLLGSEQIGFRSADDWPLRFVAVLLIVALVPTIALFQTGILTRRLQNGIVDRAGLEGCFRRMSVAHCLVWLTASAAIVGALRWQDVVRGSWRMEGLVLIDELLLIAPAISGLVLSWMVFFRLQVLIDDEEVVDIGNWFRSAVDFVAVRFKTYFVTILIPVAIVLLILDLHRAGFSTSQLHWITLGNAVLLVLAWPWILMLVWKTERLSLTDHPWLEQFNRETALDAGKKIRRWDTGQQLVNAAAVGWLPGRRFIFVSDTLLDRFPGREQAAIIRHEIGHLRQHHLWCRVGLILLPLAVLFLTQAPLQAVYSLKFEMHWSAHRWVVDVAPFWCVSSLLILSLAGWSIKRLSHDMEYEADYLAMKSRHDFVPSHGEQNERAGRPPILRVEPQALQELRSALIRLSAYAGDHWTRATWLHPSLKSRLEFVDLVECDDQVAARQQAKIGCRRRRVLWSWLLVVVFAAAIRLI